MKKWLKYTIISTVLLVFMVNFDTVKAAEETLSCNYEVTTGGAKYYADCTFKIDGSKLKSRKCQMSYYFSGKQKTKNVNVQNDSTDSSKFIYSKNSGETLEENITKTKQCPNYAIGYYKIQSSFSVDTTEVQIYMAEDEASKDNIVSSWNDSGVYVYNDVVSKDAFLLVLRNSTLGYSESEVNSIYDKIVENTKTLQTKIDAYNIDECRNSDVLYTKYSECEKQINSIETIYEEFETNLNDYIKNYKLNQNDERIQNLKNTINNAKDLVSENKSIINNYDCDRKLQLGLVKNCSKDIVSDNTNPTITSVCDNISETSKLLKQIYSLLKYLIPILVIGLSIVDFLKVIVSGEEKVFKETWTKFVKRIIVGIVILVLPAILSLIINLSGVLDNYDIDKDNIFCILK